MERCGWSLKSELLKAYHDREWGVPVFDEHKHFEFLTLEAAQAGLSWATILGKRENYRRAYDGFDPRRVAGYDAAKIAAILADAGLVRNRLKIEASIVNAGKFLEIQQEFGSFSAYIWRFTAGRPVDGQRQRLEDLPAATALSETVSRDLKQRGFRFLGSVVMYAHLQAVGLVNDHLVTCFRYAEIKALSPAL